MAVKQNNTESNASASGNTTQSAASNVKANVATSNASVSVGGVGGSGSVNGGGVKTKIKTSNMNEINDVGSGVGGGGGLGSGDGSNTDQCGAALNAKNHKKSNLSHDPDEFSDSGKKPPSDITQILQIIDLVEYKQQERALSLNDILPIYQHLLVELARIQFPRSTTEDRQRFKEAITKIGEFFAKPNDKNVYFFYLRVIWQLITESQETPSCALAIIFGFFDPDMIIDAVQMLLEHKISHSSISHTVRLLCNWLAACTFCQNLHLWIVTILGVLKEQQKFALLEEIAYENVDSAFSNLVVPLLRPKTLPLCFFFLSSVSRTPRVFHKIVPRIPKVLKFLKQQTETLDDAKQTLQKLASLIGALMSHFSGYDEMYQPVLEALKECQLGDSTFGVESSGNDDMQHFARIQNNAKSGLVNLGNTCYMNSVLQALANTQEFSRDILLCKSSSPLIIRMQEQIALMLYSYREELTPARVLNVARPPGFVPGLQQDSSEFLSYLLETLHEQEISGISGSTAAALESTKLNCAKAETRENEAAAALNEQGGGKEGEEVRQHDGGATALCEGNSGRGLQETVMSSVSKATAYLSTIERTFTGKQATTYRCLTCGCKSRNVDIFRDLQLSFPELKNDCASNYSVQDLLDFYCSPEKLDGDNQYFCERCKCLTDAERSVRVISAPKNLIITLKHFKYDHKYHTRAKLMHKVFHDEKVYVKICAAEILEEIASAHYDLYASVVHSGYSMDSGHYYTYAADASKRWYKFNDNIVTPAKAEELHNLSQPNTPYILFYQMAARSNECLEGSIPAQTETTVTATVAATASTTCSRDNQIVKIERPIPLKLEELPCSLQEYVNRDNNAYNEELKMRRLKNMKTSNAYNVDGYVTRSIRRNDHSDDEDDDNPPTAGCGDNALSFNVNRFVC